MTFVVIRTSIHPTCFLRLEGLDLNATYMDESTGAEYHGDTLHEGDSVVVHLIRKNK